MATTTLPRSPAPVTGLYLVNGPVDFLAIGGLSLLLFAGIGVLQILEVDWFAWLVVTEVLSWLINSPHFFATSYRLYHSRDNIRQYPMTAIVVPAVLIGIAAASLSWPTLVAPTFIKIFLIWSPYHYAAQSLGISLLYVRRAGLRIGGLERFALSAFVFSTFLVLAVQMQSNYRGQFHSVIFDTFQLPAFAMDLAMGWMGLCGLFLSGVFIRWSIREGRVLPPIVLLPALSQFVWFIVGESVPHFLTFVPFAHGLQYLFIAWAVQLKEVKDERQIDPSRRFVAKESLRWGVLILLGGGAFFWAAPEALAAYGIPYGLAAAVVVATVNVHHFFVDGVIWKLRNPRVGSVLSVDIAELTGRTR